MFIAVGAVLGFFGFAVLAWRGLVAWSVNRSVKQAAMVQSSETKGLLRASSRKKRRRSSRGQPNLPPGIGGGGAAAAGVAAGGHHRRTSSHGHGTPNMTKITSSSNNGLFFSPTAGATRHAHGHAYGQNGPAKRAPNYSHPSPYYGTGSSTPVSGPTPGPGSAAAQWQPPYRPRTHTHSQQPTSNPNLSPSNSTILYPYPYSQQHQYPGGISDTRQHQSNPTSRPLSSSNTSNSTLNLATPPHGRRAPSEYLEDLFESHGQAPPPPPPPPPGDWRGRA